tara:strand:- start:60 stop:488 length:429 start_codon:yes stop_codon:yes gene_type:complete
MKAWLKYGLRFGIIASLLFLILSGFGAASEGNIIAALIFIPVFPIMILLAPLVDLVEGSAGSSFFAAMIASVLVFIGYFIWGMIISKIKSIESTKKKIITIVVIIVAFLILYFVFGFIMALIMLKGLKQGIQPIELFLSMIR